MTSTDFTVDPSPNRRGRVESKPTEEAMSVQRMRERLRTPPLFPVGSEVRLKEDKTKVGVVKLCRFDPPFPGKKPGRKYRILWEDAAVGEWKFERELESNGEILRPETTNQS